MNTTSWIVWGLGLTCVAGMVHGAGPAATEPMAAVYGTMPALIIGAAGQYCLWRGLRSGMGDLWGGLGARKSRTGDTGKATRGAPGPGAVSEPQSDFDADAAFARYMEQRAAQGEVDTEPPPRAPAQATPVLPRPGPRAPGGGFGRKVT